MADSFLDDCGGWTPAPDVLTRNKRYGFEGAYLWGRLRRLCQLGGGTYKISHEALGDRIGMSRRTVIKYLDRLIEDGYVEDLDSGVKNRAHTYSVKKGEAKILTGLPPMKPIALEQATGGMQISHTQEDIPAEIPNPVASDNDVGMRNLHSDDAEFAHLDDVGMQDLPSRYAEIAHPGMQNLHLNRDSLETLKETKESEEESGKPPPSIEYTPFLRGFLDRFSAKRFRNPTQYKTVSDLTAAFGEAELSTLAEWAANKGMGLGQAIPAIKSALTKPQARTNGHHGTSQNQPRPDAQHETGGLSETSKALKAAWDSKRRASRG